VTPSNQQAAAFIDGWPDWPARVAVLYGPGGCGKSHLSSLWREKSGARIVAASEVVELAFQPGEALVIEDVDSSEASPARDNRLFATLESGGWALLTGTSPPATWRCVMPDLASRFSASIAIPLEAADEALLAGLARKLFSDRQLFVPDAVIETMLRRADRSPAAVRDFVAELDAAALAGGRPVSVALVRLLLAEREGDPP
jgi:chromosomal replication initiation ATPase DnaA